MLVLVFARVCGGGGREGKKGGGQRNDKTESDRDKREKKMNDERR